jgi:hypothetical protein
MGGIVVEMLEEKARFIILFTIMIRESEEGS